MMKLSVLIVLSLFVLATCEEVDQKEGIYILNSNNFDKFIKANKFVFVQFFAPWCGHCAALAPEYVRAAVRLQDDPSGVKLAKVDGTVEKELAANYKVQAFPTLQFFTDGTPSVYKGGRKTTEMVTWLKKKTGPPAKHLKTLDDATTFVDSDEVVVLGFFQDQESPAANAYKKVATDIDDLSFGITANETLFQEYEMDKDGIVIMKRFDNERVDYSGDLEEEAISKHIKNNRLPLIVEFVPETSAKIFDGELKNHILLFLEKNKNENLLAQFMVAAGRFKGKVLFVYVDTLKIENVRVMDFFDLKMEEVPAVRLVTLGDEVAKYKPETTALDTASISAFVQDFVDGKAKRYLRSQEVPTDWDSKPVKVLVSNNYQEVALDKSKHVFLEFFAPWCGHCKKMEPEWDKLGETFKDSEDVIIAKMDATANEVEGITITTFPTLKFYPKNSDEIIEFKGERTLEAFTKFVKSGGTEQEPVKKKGNAEDEDDDDDDRLFIIEDVDFLDLEDMEKKGEKMKKREDEIKEKEKKKRQADRTDL